MKVESYQGDRPAVTKRYCRSLALSQLLYHPTEGDIFRSRRENEVSRLVNARFGRLEYSIEI